MEGLPCCVMWIFLQDKSILSWEMDQRIHYFMGVIG